MYVKCVISVMNQKLNVSFIYIDSGGCVIDESNETAPPLLITLSTLTDYYIL
jgi:hypothetical protein